MQNQPISRPFFLSFSLYIFHVYVFSSPQSQGGIISNSKQSKRRSSLLLHHITALGVRSRLGSSLAVKDEARMAEAERNGGDDDEDALEENKGHLVGDDLASIALPELGNTIGATGEDEQDAGEQAGEEGPLAPAHGAHAAGAPVAGHVVPKGGEEGDEDDDLEDEAGHGDVDAGLVGAAGVGGQGAAGGLEDEADDVGGDEDPVEELGLEAGELWGEVDDGLGEGDVDGGREEDGGDGEADWMYVSGFLRLNLRSKQEARTY